MRSFVRNEIPHDFDPRLVKILRDYNGYLDQVEKGFGSIQRGEKPVAGGALPSQQLVDESKFVLLAGRNGGQSIKGSPSTIGSTGVTLLELIAYNDASAASIKIDNTSITYEASQMVFRAPSHDDQPLLFGFGTTSFPVINYVGVTLTGVLSLQGVPSSDNYVLGVNHSNLPTTSVTAWVQKRASQTGNLFEWRTGVTAMSYIRASDGGFVGPFTATGSDVHPDNIFQVTDDGDPSKILMLQASGITTGTTRTWTVPDFDGTPALFRSGKLRIGDATAPTHRLEIAAGDATTAPMLFTSGTLLTTPVTGALEFFANRLYSTSSVGPTRRIVMMVASSTPLTTTRVPYATTAGEITQSPRFTFTDSATPHVLTVSGTIKADAGFSGGALMASEGGLNVQTKVNFGFGVSGYVDDPNIKVQSQYLDTTTGSVNITGLSSKLRVEPASSSSANFIAMDGYAAVSSANITPSGIGVGVVGLRGVVEVNTSSTIDSVTGLTGLIYTSSNSPTITNAFAIGVRWSHTSGTIVNAYGIYIQDPASSVAVTNNYMLYLENAQEGTTLNYSIFAAGGPSVHAGTFRIGDTTAAAHRLEIAAGTTTIAPIQLTGSSGITTPAPGCIEYDNIFFYLTHSDAVRTNVVTNRGTVDVLAQTAAIGATTLYNPGASGGVFVVHYYLETTTAGAGAGTIQFQINYTDDIGATTQVGAALVLTATGRDSGSFVVYESGGGLISYQTNNVGGFGAGAQYALHVRIASL